nr:hypothetical protein [Paracoccus sp. (in: a-proteobacteria)]
MPDEPAILGFRQDRVGARLICILNVLRLGALFGVPARFAWLSQPGGPYPDLADPAEILSRGFIRDHLLIVDEAPDRAGRESLPLAAAALPVAQMAELLGQGKRWFCDAAFEMLAFRGERAADVAAQTGRLVADLPLAGPLARAHRKALVRLARVGDETPVAIHVRRGDILDGDPWSFTAWPSKYVPDEFFRAFIAGTMGPVVAFSDTPEAVRHLAQGDPRIVPVGDLIDDAGLSTVQRDVLELLLMAGCSKVGAPDSSAFSRAAQVVGGVRVVPLPAGLPNAERLAAFDALLGRAMSAPGSFLAPGDRAQSLHHAAAHAGTTGRGGELVAACGDDHALLDRFPFLMGTLAVLAVRSGQTGRALDLARRMPGNDRLQRRDLIIGEQVGLAARVLESPDAPPDAVEAEYLFDLFVGRRANGLLMPWLGGLILGRAGAAARSLRLTPELVRRLAGTAPQDSGNSPAQPAEVPPWIAQLGWVELVETPGVLQQLRHWPPAARKLAPAAAVL